MLVFGSGLTLGRWLFMFRASVDVIILLYYYIIYYTYTIIIYYTILFSSSDLFLSLLLFCSILSLFLPNHPHLFLPIYSSFPLLIYSSVPFLFPSTPLPPFLPTLPFSSSHLPFPHSFYTCRYLDTLIYIPDSSPKLTPHVLSEWMVEV